MIRSAVLALWLTATPLWAEVYPALHAVTGVAADDVLNIRAAPDATSDILAALPSDATGIEVVAVAGDWAILNSGEAMGYAALRFLQREAGPDWNTLQRPLSCFGTEPYWSMEIDPKAGEIHRQTPDDAAPAAAPLTVAWLGSPVAPDMAVALPDGLALLSPKACSDGMSDRRYGISVQVFRTGLGYVDRETGCCRLAAP